MADLVEGSFPLTLGHHYRERGLAKLEELCSENNLTYYVDEHKGGWLSPNRMKVVVVGEREKVERFRDTFYSWLKSMGAEL
jgi:hypothetical protein